MPKKNFLRREIFGMVGFNLVVDKVLLWVYIHNRDKVNKGRLN